MSADGVGAVDRALSIVEAFKDGDDKISLQTLSARTKLNKATIIRLIASLEKFGYVHRISQGIYALGPAFLKFSECYKNNFQLSDHIQPALRQLMYNTGESAAFFIRDGDMRVCLYKVESTTSVLVSRLQVGDSRSILPSGTGKVLLAFSPIFSERKGWENVANNYYSVSKGEREADISSVAAPIFKSNQEMVGALSVSGPTANFTDEAISTYKAQLLSAAADLTSRLGGDDIPLRERITKTE